MSRILSKAVLGYNQIEPILLSCLARKFPVCIQGRHGLGKTTLGRLMAEAIAPNHNGFRYFSCDKANLIILGGLPDVEKSKQTGSIEFIPSKISIWDADVILADELPRANKEAQNYWLEITENQTFFGKPISQNKFMLIATGNDQTYSGSFKFDIALKSRFYAWIPAPDFDTIESNEIVHMIGMNRDRQNENLLTKQVATELRNKIDAINVKYGELIQNEVLCEQVSRFIGTFFQLLKAEIAKDDELRKHEDSYIPPRSFAYQFPELVFALAAYFYTENHGQPLIEAANQAIRYNVITRHAAAGPKIESIASTVFRNIKGLLTAATNTPEGKLDVRYASSISPEAKLTFWQSSVKDCMQHWTQNKLISTLGETLQYIKQTNFGLIGQFWSLCRQNTVTEQVANEVEGTIITEIAHKISSNSNARDYNSPEYRLAEKFKNFTALNSQQISEILN